MFEKKGCSRRNLSASELSIIVIIDKMPFLRSLGIPVIVNVAGQSVEDFVSLTAKLSSTEGINALELNVLCPNVKDGGMIFGQILKWYV